jgi:hypothetical protein
LFETENLLFLSIKCSRQLNRIFDYFRAIRHWIYLYLIRFVFKNVLSKLKQNSNEGLNLELKKISSFSFRKIQMNPNF